MNKKLKNKEKELVLRVFRHIFLFNMLIPCKVCPISHANFSFPKDRTKCFRWMNLLEMRDVPEPNSRVCTLHFAHQDFFFDGRKMVLVEGAVPLPLEEVILLIYSFQLRTTFHYIALPPYLGLFECKGGGVLFSRKTCS